MRQERSLSSPSYLLEQGREDSSEEETLLKTLLSATMAT